MKKYLKNEEKTRVNMDYVDKKSFPEKRKCKILDILKKKKVFR